MTALQCCWCAIWTSNAACWARTGQPGGAFWSRSCADGGRWPRTSCSRSRRCRIICCCWHGWAPGERCRHLCWSEWLSGVQRARALMAGMAAHSFLSPSQPFSASFGIVMAAAAHAVGWPIPRGGSQAITDALIAHLRSLGGTVQTSTPIERIEDVGQVAVALCDTTPRQLLGWRASSAFGGSPALRALSSRAGHLQSGLRAERADSVAREGLRVGGDGARRRRRRGDCGV